MKLRIVSLCISMLALLAWSGVGSSHAKGKSEAAAPVPSEGKEMAMQPVASVEGITEYDLSNGLRVLLFPDPSKETATVCVTYLVGSRCEDYGETGMAHLLEHMAFKGTPNHKDIYGELTSHGCRSNASTSYDRTNYFETFAASDENLGWALGMEADRMVNSFIARKDLDSEMTVVRNEYEQGENNPQGVLEERLLSVAYLWHNYGNPTIGARSDIEQVPIERLQAFYHKWYQPDNAVLVVAGKIDPTKTLGLVQKTFGAIPRPTRALPVTYTIEPPQDGERSVTLRRVGDTQAAAVVYHVPAGSSPDFAAVKVLAFILGDTPAGRLHKALVETKMATSVESYAYQLKDPGILIARAEVPSDKSVQDVRDKLAQIVEASGQAAPSKEECDRAKDHLLKDWETSMRNTDRIAIGLSEWSAMGDWRLFFLDRDRVQAVTPADVQRVASLYLKETNRTVGLFLPTKAAERVEVAAAGDVGSMVKDYKGGGGLSAGAEFTASPESIETKITRLTLPNGLKVVLLPKKTRGSTVQVVLNLHFGDETSLKGLSSVGDLTAAMLMRGTTAHTRQQISDETDHLKAQLRVFGSATGVNAGLETNRENLLAALALMSEVLRAPAFPDSELAMLKQENTAQLKDDKTDPAAIARLTLQRHMSPHPADDVRYVMTPDEQITAIAPVMADQLRRFHQQFYGASSGEAAIVGDFDPRDITPAMTRLFGDWKSATAYTRIASPYIAVDPINQTIETPDKESAVLAGSYAFEMRDDDPDYPAMAIGTYMTGGGFLHSRLETRIRQKEGLSYGAGAFYFASSFDKSAFMVSRAIYAPQNDERLMRAFNEEIARVAKDGFTAEEVDDAKSGWLQQRRVSRSNDRELVRALNVLTEAGRTLAWSADLEKRVAALTPDDINATFHRRLDPSKMCIVRAGDFAKAKNAAMKTGDTSKGAAPAEKASTPSGAPSSSMRTQGGGGIR